MYFCSPVIVSLQPVSARRVAPYDPNLLSVHFHRVVIPLWEDDQRSSRKWFLYWDRITIDSPNQPCINTQLGQ